jgi:hypothetical protein
MQHACKTAAFDVPFMFARSCYGVRGNSGDSSLGLSITRG